MIPKKHSPKACATMHRPFSDDIELFDNTDRSATSQDSKQDAAVDLASNEEEAFKWFYKAAVEGLADAQTKLGFFYESGIGAEVDFDEAIYWYQQAANQGNADAKYYLGSCFSAGIGVLPDILRAVELYTDAAEAGNAAAQNNLGYFFMKGFGVKKDYSEAEKWYKKSVASGYPAAKFNLAYFYEKGYAGKAKVVKTQELLSLYKEAAEGGIAKASEALQRIQAK